MIDTQTRTINGVEYQVTQFPALYAMRMAARLTKLVGPGLAGALGGKQSLASVMDADIDFGAAISAIVGSIDDTGTPDLIRDLLSSTRRDGKDLSSESVFNTEFAGNLSELIPALSFVLEVNFGDFQGALGLIGDLGAQEKPAETSPEN